MILVRKRYRPPQLTTLHCGYQPNLEKFHAFSFSLSLSVSLFPPKFHLLILPPKHQYWVIVSTDCDYIPEEEEKECCVKTTECVEKYECVHQRLNKILCEYRFLRTMSVGMNKASCLLTCKCRSLTADWPPTKTRKLSAVSQKSAVYTSRHRNNTTTAVTTNRHTRWEMNKRCNQ